LVASGVHEIVIRRREPAIGEVCVHFPRAGFVVAPAYARGLIDVLVSFGIVWMNKRSSGTRSTHRSAKSAAALTPEIVEIFGAPPLLSREDGRASDDRHTSSPTRSLRYAASGWRDRKAMTTLQASREALPKLSAGRGAGKLPSYLRRSAHAENSSKCPEIPDTQAVLS